VAGSAIRGIGGNTNHRRVRRALLAAFAVLATVPFIGPARAAPGPSATLEQCKNGNTAPPPPKTCDWITGNLGPQNSSWAEAESVPYRLKLGNLATTGTHTVTIEFDPTKAGKHAFDYLTTYDRSATTPSVAAGTTPNPCLGVSGCVLANTSTVGIPADPNVTVTQIPGVFTIWNGTFVGSPSAYSTSGSYAGDSSTRITLTFTASAANPVIAWSGHIADDFDWGPNTAASAISGSPYHMRLIEVDGFGGNQDRSMKVAAGPVPASITIVKQASVEGSRAFSFTASDGLGNFTLVDDGDEATAPFNSMTFDGLTDFFTTSGNTYDFTETVPTGWQAPAAINCTGGTATVTGSTVKVALEEDTHVVCTFTNTNMNPTVAITKTPNVATVPEPGAAVTFQLAITNTSAEDVTLYEVSDSDFGTQATACGVPRTLTAGQTITCSFNGQVSGNAGFVHTNEATARVRDADGATAAATAPATVTVTDVLPTITVSKTAAPTTVPEPGGRVTFTVVMENTSVEAVTVHSLIDSVYGDVSSGANTKIAASTCAVGGSIPAGDDYTCTFTVDIVGKAGFTETNRIEATVHDNDGNDATATDTATVTVTAAAPPVIDPRIAIDKSADPKSATPGDRVVYTYLVTNPGDAVLTKVVVTDDKCAPVTFVSGDADGDGALDVGETWRYTCAVTVGSDITSLTNIGTVTAEDPNGGTVSANDSETITIVLGAVIERPRAAVAQTDLPDLPRTGQDVGALSLAGAALVALGSVLVVCAPRRRRPTA
jgi:uncharacterized repeat protein (TIGR01451 family)